jgi:hypothetical protein
MRLQSLIAASRNSCVALLVAVLAVFPASAAEILVSSSWDGFADGDGCGLREALVNAMTDSRQGSHECARGESGSVDVILLPPVAIQLQEPLVITSDVVIKGGSATWSKLDGNDRVRIFDVVPGVELTLRGVELTKGVAADAGAAVRLQDGAKLKAEYVVITASRISKWVANPAATPPVPAPPVQADGAGVYVGSGAEAVISRSQISGNDALHPGARGAGVYCAAGCSVFLSNSTVSSNRASGSGGGVHVDGTASFEFVTVGRNEAALGAGVQVNGTLQVFASIVADNGSGALGADLDCAGATPASAVTASGPSLVEMPGVECSVIAEFITRSAVSGGMPADVLYSIAGSRFAEAPSRVQRPVEQFFPYVLRKIDPLVPQCAALNDRTRESYGDQHGRARAVVDRCDLGAYQKPMVEWWRLGLALQHTSLPEPIPFSLDEPPVGDVTVRLKARQGGGIGEECSGAFTDEVVIPAGARSASFVINPGAVFDRPALNRPARVCEYEVELDAPGDPRLHGATAGNTRIRVQGVSATQAAISNPPPATYVDFKTVPVGSGGSKSVLLSPPVGGFHIVRVVIEGTDKERFEVVSGTLREATAGSGEYLPVAPLTVVSGALGGTAITLRCRPGEVGDFEAQLTIETDSGDYGELGYGLRCSAAHFLAYSVTEDQILEDGSVTSELVLSLDSPCQLEPLAAAAGACFVVNVSELPGSASSGLDYESFGGDVVFMPGDSRKSVPLRALNDDDVEDVESFGLRVLPPSNVPYLKVPAVSNYSVKLKDDDEPLRSIKAFIRQLPASAGPGSEIPFIVSVHNRGTVPLRGARIEIAVGQPMWIKHFLLAGANCSVDDSRRKATCQLGGLLLANLIPVPVSADPVAAEVALAADEADSTRWEDPDWVHLYGRLVTADMTRPPTMDVSGVVSVSARAGDPEEISAVSRSLLVNAPPLQEFGGTVGFHWLVLALLPLRRKLSEAVGRKAERRGTRMLHKWYIRLMFAIRKRVRTYGV